MTDKLFRDSVKLFRANWKKLVLYTFLIQLISMVANSIGQRLPSGLSFFGAILVFLLSIATQAVMTVLVLRTAVDGQVPTLSVSWQAAKKRYVTMLALVGWAILFVFAAAICVAALFALLGFLSNVVFGDTSVSAWLVGIFSMIAYVYLLIRLGFVGVVIMDTELGARDSMRRSLAVTRNRVVYILRQNLPIIGIGLIFMIVILASLVPVAGAYWSAMWSSGVPVAIQDPLSILGPMLFWLIPVWLALMVLGLVFTLIVQLTETKIYLRLKDMATDAEPVPMPETASAEQPMPTEQPEAPAGE